MHVEERDTMKTPAKKMIRKNAILLENGMEKQPWTEEKLKELILIYKAMPELWDRTHKKFKNKNNRQMLFEKLAAHFNTSIDDVRLELRYHKFRIQYSLKRIQQNLTPRKPDTVYTNVKWVKDSCFMVTKKELLLNVFGNIPDNNAAVEQSNSVTCELLKTSQILSYDTLPNKGIRLEQSKLLRRHSDDSSSSKDVACDQSKTSRLTNDCLANDGVTCDLSKTSKLCYDSLPNKGIRCDQTESLRRHSCDSQASKFTIADQSKLSRLTNNPFPHKCVTCDVSQTPTLTTESISNKVVSSHQSKASRLSYDSLPNQAKRCSQLKGSRRNSYDSLSNKSVKCEQSSGLTKNIARRHSVDIAMHEQHTISERVRDPNKPQTNKNILANIKWKNKSEEEIKKWTYEETLELLEMYERTMPEFWNRSLENHTWSKKERDRKYDEMSYFFCTSARQVGMRIDYLKKRFLNEKRVLQIKSLKYNKPINEIESKWQYWKPMRFYLANYMGSKDWSSRAYTQVSKRRRKTQQRRITRSLNKDRHPLVAIDSSEESNSSRTFIASDLSDNQFEDSDSGLLIPLKKQSFTSLEKNVLPDGKIVKSEIIEYEDSDSESEQIDQNKYLTPEGTVMKSDLISFEDTDIQTSVLNAQCFPNQFQNEESIAKSANRIQSETIGKSRFEFEESDSGPILKREENMLPVISSVKTVLLESNTSQKPQTQQTKVPTSSITDVDTVILIDSGDESDSSRTLSVPDLSDYEFEDTKSELRNGQYFTTQEQYLLPDGKISKTEIQFEDENDKDPKQSSVPEISDQTIIQKLERYVGNLNSEFKPHNRQSNANMVQSGSNKSKFVYEDDVLKAHKANLKRNVLPKKIGTKSVRFKL